jgi:hypothetical protein
LIADDLMVVSFHFRLLFSQDFVRFPNVLASNHVHLHMGWRVAKQSCQHTDVLIRR